MQWKRSVYYLKRNALLPLCAFPGSLSQPVGTAASQRTLPAKIQGHGELSLAHRLDLPNMLHDKGRSIALSVITVRSFSAGRLTKYNARR